MVISNVALFTDASLAQGLPLRAIDTFGRHKIGGIGIQITRYVLAVPCISQVSTVLVSSAHCAPDTTGTTGTGSTAAAGFTGSVGKLAGRELKLRSNTGVVGDLAVTLHQFVIGFRIAGSFRCIARQWLQFQST